LEGREQRTENREQQGGENAKTTRNDDWERRGQRTENREQYGEAKMPKQRGSILGGKK
jgi:hypothetical protein